MSDGKFDSVVNGALVLAVGTRQVSNGTKTLWEIQTQDGTVWTTFKTDLGNQAKALEGQAADLKVTIQKKDQYTNYYLNAIRPSQGTQTPSPVSQAVQQAQEAAQGKQEVSYATYKSLEGEKQESIHRQVAAKVAATLTGENGTAADFWVNAEEILSFFRTGKTPGTKTSVTSHAATDTFGTQGAPPPSDWDTLPADDDIPF